MNKYPYNNVGFTLVELLVTIAIASLLFAVAAPNFINLVSSNATKNTAERLMNSLAFARSEAVSRSTSVTVCSKAAGTNTCSDADAWNNGWVIFVDGAGAANIDGVGVANDLLLKVETLNLNILLNGSPTAASVVYNSLGEASAITINFMGADGFAGAGVDVSVSAQGLALATSRR